MLRGAFVDGWLSIVAQPLLIGPTFLDKERERRQDLTFHTLLSCQQQSMEILGFSTDILRDHLVVIGGEDDVMTNVIQSTDKRAGRQKLIGIL